METDNWKTIPNFTKYEASVKGEIRNAKTKRVLKPSTNPKNKYLYCSVLNDLTGKRGQAVHSLVASTFIKIGGGEYKDMVIDHIDRIRTNNTVENLRIITKQENARNASKKSNSACDYKGVSMHRKSGKYQSVIRIDGKLKHLGYFDTQEEALETYNAKAKEIDEIHYHTDKTIETRLNEI